MKHVHRFFVSRPLSTGEKVRLEEGDSFHAVRVLRLRSGEAIELADSRGHVFSARVIHADGVLEALAGGELARQPQVELTVDQAIPRGRRMDLVVEKLSELGVTRLVPLHTRKTVVRPPAGKARLERWRRIAREAAKQSRRDGVMEIGRPRRLEEWLPEQGDGLVTLVTEVPAEPLGEVAASLADAPCLLVGPEAGFEEDEIELLGRAGSRFAALGPLLLRSETAAVVAAAIVMHRLGIVG